MASFLGPCVVSKEARQMNYYSIRWISIDLPDRGPLSITLFELTKIRPGRRNEDRVREIIAVAAAGDRWLAMHGWRVGPPTSWDLPAGTWDASCLLVDLISPNSELLGCGAVCCGSPLTPAFVVRRRQPPTEKFY